MSFSETRANKKFHQTLIEKPEFLFLPTLAIWLFVNVPPWQIFDGQSLALFMVRTGLLMGPTSGSVQSEIFPLTYFLAWASIVIALYLLKTKVKLNWVRALILSVTFPFAFVAFFEEIWQNLWIVRDLPPPISNEIWMASWVVLGCSTIQFWKFSKKSLIVLLVLILGFGTWAASGYQQLSETNNLLIPILNWITKSGTFLLFAFLLYDGTKRQFISPRAVQNTNTNLNRRPPS
ncbi:MAG: hypothetical protein ACHQ1H_01235 [Nitrososphaerales archaeon]